MFWRKRKHKAAQIPVGSLCIRAIQQTDKGCVRQNNEDMSHFLFLKGSKINFLAVLADGMGGYECGEVASQTAVETVCSMLNENNNSEDTAIEKLRKAFTAANRKIMDEIHKKEEMMGTTCTALLIQDSQIYCAHIGDSRLYLLKDKQLRHITFDHTWVNEMVRIGKIKPRDAQKHPERNVLHKAMGVTDQIEPDIFQLDAVVNSGCRFLLCSDGLYDLVEDKEIEQLLSIPSLKLATTSLIALSKERGGYDNITVLIVEITL